MAAAVSAKTLFFRNLPYRTTDSELEQACARYGTVKACFTVKERGTSDRCRGFGYVTYDSREDAEKAKALIKVIGGRPVQIVFAKKREPRKKEAKMKESDGGREYDSDSSKEEGEGESNRDTSEERGASSDSDEDYEMLSAKMGGRGRKHKLKRERSHAKFDTGRVVVISQLPENTAVEKLREECEKIGKVETVEFPVPDREIPSAFVAYSTHKEARSAVSYFNGRTVNCESPLSAQLLSREGKEPSKRSLKKSRLIVRNLSFKCSDADVRKVFEKHGQLLEVHIPRKPNGHMLGYAFVQYTSYFDAKKALEGVNMTEIKGRRVAVDWVVPKDQYEQSVKREDEGEGREEGEGMESDGEAEPDVDDAGDLEESDCESHDTSHDMSHDESVSDVDEKTTGKAREDVSEGKTIFIRNLPLDVEHKELKQLFYKFGRVRYCRVMVHPDTGLCTGSAFLQFKDPQSVKLCLSASASTEDVGVVYHGHHLDVSVALSRGEVEEVCREREEGKRVRGEDKRNLYLAKEGVILPGSEAAGELSKTDMARRMKIYSQKKSKLMNPYFFVSKTRLSIHNIPVSVDESRLKRVLLHAAGDKDARISQVKILRSSERVNAKGVGRSLGYGFVEFTSHEAALAALRSTNNNPKTFGEKRRLIVEFAVEDSRAIKLREKRKQRQVMIKPSSSPGQSGISSAETDKDKPLTKRQKWMLKCQAKRLRRKERKNCTNADSARAHEETKEKSAVESVVCDRPPSAGRSVKVIRHDQAGINKNIRTKSLKGRKRKWVESREEEAFARMVDKYRKKLKQTDS